jgi:hypothetical protein
MPVLRCLTIAGVRFDAIKLCKFAPSIQLNLASS